MVVSGVRNSCDAIATKRDFNSPNSRSFFKASSSSIRVRLRSLTSKPICQAAQPGTGYMLEILNQEMDFALPSLQAISHSQSR